MTTMVGKEDNLVDLLQDLIKLDYDAIEAYEAAIERLDDIESQQRLREFMADHQRHTENLATYLRAMGEEVPEGPGGKALLAAGKVVVADLFGDKAVLKAMKTNEDDTNTAYERAVNHADATPEIRATLQENLQDERRHRAWIEQATQTRKAA